ncbi:MAG TPA: transposase [Planctomycetota bacterium]|jgi:hypothetical protein
MAQTEQRHAFNRLIASALLFRCTTDENRKHFGKPGASRGPAAYPQMRYSACEIQLARELLSEIPVGSLTLMDRHFLAYDFLWDLWTSGREFLVRVPRNIKPRLIKRLGPGDAIVEVAIPRNYRRTRPDMPKTWILRMISYRPSGSKETIRLFMSLTAELEIPKEEFAALYHEHWGEETVSLWIKTAQAGKILTSLDHNIRCGNSLISDNAFHPRAFNWQTTFPEVFAAGGFDVTLGNPPYVRQELLSAVKPFLQEHYRTFHGMADLYVYFYELGLNVLKPGGRLSFIVTMAGVYATSHADSIKTRLPHQQQGMENQRPSRNPQERCVPWNAHSGPDTGRRGREVDQAPAVHHR